MKSAFPRFTAGKSVSGEWMILDTAAHCGLVVANNLPSHQAASSVAAMLNEQALILPDGTRHEGRLQADDDGRVCVDVTTCGACDYSWPDALITSLTPTPAGRCPNEYGHAAMPPAAPDTAWLYKHGELVSDADFRAALKLAHQIASLAKDGEMVDGEAYVMENDDAVDSLHSLITEARNIYGMEQ